MDASEVVSRRIDNRQGVINKYATENRGLRFRIRLISAVGLPLSLIFGLFIGVNI